VRRRGEELRLDKTETFEYFFMTENIIVNRNVIPL
jgi:hypothetical protein